ncbi:glutamine synthetase family protein [Ruegeria jejuensis]|uniref:glutamine synthetase family protein n=1 Tax=Ruegeria jejuensis TaxID=3233338 RepID=UPI00355C43B6
MDLTELRHFRVATCDLNGQMRGKWVPGAYGAKLESGALRMPLSAANVDLWGADIADSPLLFKTGDADGILRPTERGVVPAPWAQAETALVPMVLHNEDGTAFDGDPRHALARVLDRYAARSWTVLAATELEFTLVDASGDSLRPPLNPLTGQRLEHPAVLSLAEMDGFEGFFNDLYDACAAMDIPAQAGISESGIGQFEVNLTHQYAMRCADDTWLFKTLARGLARKHGFAASFMAKPYAEDAGNGMHVHFSVLDRDGRNIFDDGSAEGTDTLRHAVAGCLAAAPASNLIFAPHGNSYDRLVPGAHAPTGLCWAYENRTAAIRIPGGPPAARRIEHRVAGADINPYLLLSALLGAALTGIEDQTSPLAPISGNAYEIDGLPQLCTSLEVAVTLFERDPLIARVFKPDLIRNLCLTKRQEIAGFATRPPETHWRSYVECV